MSVCWLRRADGTLIMRVVNPSAGECTFEREKPGETTVRLRADVSVEPCVAFLYHETPVDGRFCKTWWDTDLEIAWFRGSPALTADTIPEIDPTWAGPVVSAGLRMDGFLELRAWSQEAYAVRSVVGDTLINYLITGGVGDYRFSSDTSLSSWTEDSGVTSSTTNTGDMWLDDTYSALVEADAARNGIYATALVGESDNGNYATGTVAVMVPTGTALHAVDGVRQVVGSVALFVDSDLQEVWEFELPDGWEFDRFYPVSVQVRQPAGPDVSYTFSLFGGNDGPIRFGRPMFTRPANVGAAAGVDIAQVPAAILDEQVDLVPALTAYDTDAVGIDLAEKFRYFTVDHEDVSSVLGDWSGSGEWWVHEGTIYWRPERGSEITTVEVSSTDMGGWSFEVDATSAATVLYGQVRPEGGAAYEVVAGDGTPNRLCAVVQVPDGMGPGDAPEWCEKALEQRAPTVRLTGVPASYEALPGEQLAEFMPGNWMDVYIADLDLTIQPTVDAVSWHPVTDEVRPTWILGGEARQDPLELITAGLQAAERDRRIFRPQPTQPRLGKTESKTFSLSGTGSANNTVTLGEGIWSAWSRHTVYVAAGNIPAGSYIEATIYRSPSGEPYTRNTFHWPVAGSYGGSVDSPSVEIRGPVTVGAAATLTFPGGGVTVTTRSQVIYYTRIG